MRILSLLAVLTLIIFASSQTSTSLTETIRKQRPFNDEGPECKPNCSGGDKDKLVDLVTIPFITAANAPKPPFNDEGPGGNKG